MHPSLTRLPPCHQQVYEPPPPGTLHAAAAEGDTGALRALLDGGSDPNGVDAAAHEGRNVPRTPLAWAAARGRTAAAALLLRYGAAVGAAAADGQTPLDWAANQANPFFQAGAAAAGGNHAPAVIIPAAAQGRLDVALLLVQHGAAVGRLLPAEFASALAVRLFGEVRKDAAARARGELQALAIGAAREMACLQRVRAAAAAAATQAAAAERAVLAAAPAAPVRAAAAPLL